MLQAPDAVHPDSFSGKITGFLYGWLGDEIEGGLRSDTMIPLSGAPWPVAMIPVV
jgi:hypothetical protein